DCAVLDYRLPDGDALELMPLLKQIDDSVPLLVLTGHGTIDLAVRAIKEGADQFLTKPVELPALLIVLKRLLENQRTRRQQSLGRSKAARGLIDPFLGTSRAIIELKEAARKVCATESPILIQGETGSGKGVLAAWLHRHGPRADEAFVDLNCAGLNREFLETELFGHEKGAFTGAIAAKQGLLEAAQRGTVFLDEIGDMDAQVQPKLLKVLEEKRFRRLGEVRDRSVDIALIAATHQDLEVLVREKKFRGDLYFRISAIPLRVPSLRERTEDIPVIARSLLEKISADLGRGRFNLDEDAERALCAYSWPGNIRELRNVLERAALLSEKAKLSRRELNFDSALAGDTQDGDGGLTLEELEKKHIERVLDQERGHVERAAGRLGIPRSSLYQKIKRHGIVVSKI
ncbi:MAG: sigma-54-dependent transcriptional regulator, partial [Burkholderiales bacterium]